MKSIKLNNNSIVSVLKGSASAVSLSLVFILLFAFIIRFTGVSDGAIMPVNQVIKIISIFVGTYITLKDDKHKGAIKGAVVGMLYTLIAYVVFAVLSRSFSLDITTLYDLLFGTIIGAICGIINVNIGR